MTAPRTPGGLAGFLERRYGVTGMTPTEVVEFARLLRTLAPGDQSKVENCPFCGGKKEAGGHDPMCGLKAAPAEPGGLMLECLDNWIRLLHDPDAPDLQEMEMPTLEDALQSARDRITEDTRTMQTQNARLAQYEQRIAALEAEVERLKATPVDHISMPEEVREWFMHLDLHVTEYDTHHAGLALRAAWPSVRNWLMKRIAAFESELAALKAAPSEEEVQRAIDWFRNGFPNEDDAQQIADLLESLARACAAMKAERDAAVQALIDIRARPELNPPNANLLGSYKWLTDLLDAALARAATPAKGQE